MTFKEKHLIALTLGASLFLGCSEDKKTLSAEEQYDSMGLLDKRPLNEHDKYNSKITISHVDVPVYSSNGQRIKDQYVLTRGLEKSDYKSKQKPEEMKVKAVHINGNPKICYVKADANNAIFTERGFCGLFIDDNQNAIVISDDNVEVFVEELRKHRISQNSHTEQRKNVQNNQNVSTFEEVIPTDSVKADTIKNDTMNIEIVPTDTIGKKTFNKNQFADTLQSLRQRQI